MNHSTQIISNTSSLKAPKTQANNFKTSRPIAGVKQPLTSRYAQGSYYPAEEQKQKNSLISSSYARKHSLENMYGNDKEHVAQTTKRVKMHTDIKTATTSRVTLSSNTSNNIVAAARLSLKEKQLLKEKRIRKTGVVKPKPTANAGTLQLNIPSIDRAYLADNARCHHEKRDVENAKLKPIIAEKSRDYISSRRDSRYSSDGSNSSGLKDKVEDVTEMQIDADLLPVQITAMNTSSITKPKIIHVARASRTRTTMIDSKIEVEVEEKKFRHVLAAIPPQNVQKNATSVTRITSLNSLLNESKIANTKNMAVNPIPSKPISVTIKQTIPKALNAVVRKPLYKLRKKSLVVQDPIQALEYAEDIYVYWREIEINMLPDPLYIQRQNELDWGMRTTLISWLIQVHSQFKLLPETLYLTVNLIDRTLSLKLISLSKFQLVGVTALLIASKYEEILSPSVQDLVYMTDNGYSGDEILRAERHMLSITGYQIGYCNPLNFLKRVANVDLKDARLESLCHYFLELMALDHQFIGHLPSKQAAAAYFLAIKTLRDGEWTEEHCKQLGYSEQDLLSCVYTLLESLKKPQDHQIIFEKYASSQYHSVSASMRAFLLEKGIQ